MDKRKSKIEQKITILASLMFACALIYNPTTAIITICEEYEHNSVVALMVVYTKCVHTSD